MTRGGGGRRKTERSNWATNRCELKGLPSLGNSFPWLLEADFYFNTEWYHACVQNLEVVRLACVTHNVQTNVWMYPITHCIIGSAQPTLYFWRSPPLHFPRFLQPFYLPHRLRSYWTLVSHQPAASKSKPIYTLIRRRLAINKQKLSTLKEGRQELTGNSLSLANTLLTRRRSGCHPVPPGQPDRHLLPILPAFNLTIKMLNNRLTLEAQTSQARNSLLQIERWQRTLIGAGGAAWEDEQGSEVRRRFSWRWPTWTGSIAL